MIKKASVDFIVRPEGRSKRIIMRVGGRQVGHAVGVMSNDGKVHVQGLNLAPDQKKMLGRLVSKVMLEFPKRAVAIEVSDVASMPKMTVKNIYRDLGFIESGGNLMVKMASVRNMEKISQKIEEIKEK